MAQRLFMRLDDGPLEPAEFRSRQEFDGSTRYEVCCPRCRTVHVLDAAVHTVKRDGAVVPIWPCPSESCPLSEWLILEVE